MLDRVAIAMCTVYLNAKAKLMKLANEEDGMETLEAVVLIVIAVILAGLVLNFLTGRDGEDGIIQRLFHSITEKLGQFF